MATTKRLSTSIGATRQDLLDASKAIHDSINKSLPSQASKVFQQESKELERSLTVSLGKQLEREMGSEINRLVKSYEDRLDHMKGVYEKSLSELHKAYQEMLTLQDTNFKHLRELLSSLPIPQVIVPANAIQFNLQQEPITLNLPENALLVNIEQQPSIVNLPEGAIQVHVDQKPSIVNIAKDAMHVDMAAPIIEVPKEAFKVRVDVEQKTPIIHLPKSAIEVSLAQPKRKSIVQKRIEYNETTGRPDKIIEETTEE